MKAVFFLLFLVLTNLKFVEAQPEYNGQYISGKGDTGYLELLDKAFRMFRPDAELENLSMLYTPTWNGFVEGPTWNAWWIQNSFGPTYTMLPFMDMAYQTFVSNAQELWFNEIGDAVRKDANGYAAPEGSLCDCARIGFVIYKQGDGRHKIHDWAFGFTTAGIILQSELLLINRDIKLIRKYVPLLEQCADFIDSRRDPVKNIFLVGPAANLLAPSFAGSGKKLEDGTYEKSYLAEISVNYIAGLNRLIELEKILGQKDKVSLFEARRGKVKEGLKYFINNEGYFIQSLEQDGTPHGVYGAQNHGYFEATPNHDAMAFRVADDEQALKIYAKIKAIPGLRPNKLIIPNYPAYDDMYETKGYFVYGKWVNGGHWTTCEARMQLGYYRVGAYDDAKEGFKAILNLAPIFRLDNPLTEFGAGLYQPKLPVNCTYDAFGAPGGFLRGLFEYEYLADGIRIYPHIPAGITRLKQNFPVSFGEKQIYILVNGTGPITSVLVNDKKIKSFNPKSLFLKLDSKAGNIFISLGLGGQPSQHRFKIAQKIFRIPEGDDFWNIRKLSDIKCTFEDILAEKLQLRKVGTFYSLLCEKGLSHTYECKHAGLILENIQSIHERNKLKQSGLLVKLPESSQTAADDLYFSTVMNLYNGLVNHLEKSKESGSGLERKISGIWFGIAE
jgi:hypothetical protein